MSVHYNYVIHAKLLTMVQTYQGNRRDYTSNMHVAFLKTIIPQSYIISRALYTNHPPHKIVHNQSQKRQTCVHNPAIIFFYIREENL